MYIRNAISISLSLYHHFFSSFMLAWQTTEKCRIFSVCVFHFTRAADPAVWGNVYGKRAAPGHFHFQSYKYSCTTGCPLFIYLAQLLCYFLTETDPFRPVTVGHDSAHIRPHPQDTKAHRIAWREWKWYAMAFTFIRSGSSWTVRGGFRARCLLALPTTILKTPAEGKSFG